MLYKPYYRLHSTHQRVCFFGVMSVFNDIVGGLTAHWLKEYYSLWNWFCLLSVQNMCKSAVQQQLCAPRRCFQCSQTARQGVCNCNPTSSRWTLSEEDAEDKEAKRTRRTRRTRREDDSQAGGRSVIRPPQDVHHPSFTHSSASTGSLTIQNYADTFDRKINIPHQLQNSVCKI